MNMNQHSIDPLTGQMRLVCEIVCHLLQGIRGMNRPDGIPGDLDIYIYIETKLLSNGGYFACLLALLRYQRVLSEPVGCVDRMLCESNLVTLDVAHVTVSEIVPNYRNTLNNVASDRLKIVILDHLATNDSVVRRALHTSESLDWYKRIFLYFISTSTSRLNLVEGIFAKLANQHLRLKFYSLVAHLETRLEEDTACHNNALQPLVWHRSANGILRKTEGVRNVLSSHYGYR